MTTLVGTIRASYDVLELDSVGYGNTSSQQLEDFFNVGAQVCDYYFSQAKVKFDLNTTKLNKLATELAIYNEQLFDVKNKALARERRKFLEKWNDPVTNMTAPTLARVHYPNDDPLAEFLIASSGKKNVDSSPVKTYFFSPTPDGYYNQHGLSLQDFMAEQSTKPSGHDVICVFPVFNPAGGISDEMIKCVHNPQPPSQNNVASLPTIQFVETYRMEVGWQGYGLGELSHSFNLFPGESKELVVEKSTKLSTKQSQTSSGEQSATTNQTSSFEDNLQNEFSAGEKTARDQSSTSGNSASNSGASEDATSSESTSTTSANVQASVSGGGFGFSASVSGGASSGSSRKNASSSKRSSAFALSQSAEEKNASNQSKDILARNVSNAVRKVASDTSQNNKLSFSSVSSREYEESTSNRETIKLQNPNVGKTVNYNFFQLQNLFGVTVRLVDVQVIIDSGVEMVKGTGVNDVRVYSLEEFGKIYANSDKTDRAAALAAIIGRQVIRHYADFLPGVTSGNGVIALPEGISVDRNAIEVLNFSSADDIKTSDPNLLANAGKERVERIKAALAYLKNLPFRLCQKPLAEETTVAVNCGAYHVEAQLGFLPATESYLEDRREIETEKQRAMVEQLREQTKAKVFFQELPAGVTTLTMEGNSIDPV